ncbi:hypothetical protein QN277_008369 [Acacia crassicarpa]|uniref:Late embryogenesis abundant protein LEA-2 subgroup domain-containing protein n=1 Tax=Acacia crassicarpa TaxID=499986 RepID=A0AAE1IR77_9FABA|nr:hypothetical protein QN277_008369 [Acacia crassicarpa]
MKPAKRSLKICLAVSMVFLVLLAAVIVTLAFTIFKPKDPEISVKTMGFPLSPGLTGNVTVNMTVTIVNRNYASFTYENSNGQVNFEDVLLGEVPMETRSIPARTTVNFNTSADLMIGKLIKDPKFLVQVVANGTVVLRSTAILPGKVTALKIFKKKATVYNTCDIPIHVASLTKGVESRCVSKIKM